MDVWTHRRTLDDWKMDNLFSFSSPTMDIRHTRFQWQPARPPISTRYPFALSLAPAFHCLISAICYWIQGLERLQTSWTMLTMPAEERRKNGIRNLAVKPQTDAELWTRRQTSDDGESNNSLRFPSPTTAELLLFTFATVLSKSGSDQPLINLFACRQPLFSLTIHPTPSSPLNHTPMLAPSRNTTEQRYQTDALELRNDSGSLTARGNQRFCRQQKGLSLRQHRGSHQLTSALE